MCVTNLKCFLTNFPCPWWESLNETINFIWFVTCRPHLNTIYINNSDMCNKWYQALLGKAKLGYWHITSATRTSQSKPLFILLTFPLTPIWKKKSTKSLNMQVSPVKITKILPNNVLCRDWANDQFVLFLSNVEVDWF